MSKKPNPEIIIQNQIIEKWIVDSSRVQALADSIGRLKGDSLGAVARRYWLAHRPIKWLRDTVSNIDTISDTIALPGQIVRELIISDSGCRATVDSVRGALKFEVQKNILLQKSEQKKRWQWACIAILCGFAAGLALASE